MKKIFRMALVFALAGATLMYTGCTKDYSEDINKLDKELTTLENDLAGVKADLGTLQSAVNALDAAYKAADKELEGKFNDKIAAIQDALDKKADKKWAEDEMAKLKEELMAKAKELEETAEALKEEVKAALDDFYAIISGELRSLVFVPDFYYAGIEATSYDFANIKAYASEPIKEALKVNANISLLKGAKVDWARVKNAKGEFDKDYVLGQQGVAKYDVNPSNFPLDSAAWKFNKDEKEYVTRAEEQPEWKPVFEGIKYNDKAGYAEAYFSIENPDLLSVEETVPIIQLEATLEKGKTIASDWAVVTTGTEEFSDLAFTKKSKYTTESIQATGKACDDPEKENHLYTNVKNALTKDASVPVQYNGGPVDLSKIIAIHVLKDNTPVEMTLEQLQAKYPGFDLNFELVPYSAGAGATTEASYGQIDGYMFTPCYVDEKGESHPIAEGSEAGISSVGRMPVVLCTLVEPAGSIILYGNFKIEIVPQAATKDIKPIDVKDFGKLPYLCSTEISTVWYEFSANVLEAMKIDYDQFQKTYQIDTKDGLKALAQGKTYTAQIYVKGEEGFELPYILDKNGEPTDKLYDLGTVTYTVDKKGTTVNDKITWSFDKDQADNVAKFNDVYVLFMLNEYTGVAFKLSAEIADPAKFDFGGNKMANEWFDDIHVWAIDDAENNTAHMNVLVPEADKPLENPVYPEAKGGNVKTYVRNLNHYYQSYVPATELSADADPVYTEVLKDNNLKAQLNTTATYSFATEQPVINGEQLYVNEFEEIGGNAKCMVLYIGSYNAKGELITKDVKVGDQTIKVPVYAQDNCIAIIAGNSLQYQPTTAAKKLLNYWGHKETAEDKILYANIHVDVAYGTCGIEAGEADFHLRFVRPLDVNLEAQEISKDGVVDGANIYLAQFFAGIVDWNNVDVIKTSVDTTTKVKTFAPNVVSNVNMFEFYQFTNIKVDISKAMINGWGSDPKEFAYAYDQEVAGKIVPGKKPEMKLSVGWINNGQFEVSSLYDATKKVFDYDLLASGHSVEAFNTYVINYRNDAARVTPFDIQIPVSFEYAWGTYEGILEINVEGTN